MSLYHANYHLVVVSLVLRFRSCHFSCFQKAELGPPGVLGIWGEWLFIFMDLGSTGNYFRGAGEQTHSFGDLGSPAKKIKEKPPFCLIS